MAGRARLSPRVHQKQRGLVVGAVRVHGADDADDRRCATPSLGKISLTSMPLWP